MLRATTTEGPERSLGYVAEQRRSEGAVIAAAVRLVDLSLTRWSLTHRAFRRLG